MRNHEQYLEQPYQSAYAEQERAEWIEAHTCSACGSLSPYDLIDGEPCLSCCASDPVAMQASAITAALAYVAAVARSRLVDDHGVSLHTATHHARALGASHGQITTALRSATEAA